MAIKIVSDREAYKKDDLNVVRRLMERFPGRWTWVPCAVCTYLCPLEFGDKTREGKPRHWTCEEAPLPKRGKYEGAENQPAFGVEYIPPPS